MNLRFITALILISLTYCFFSGCTEESTFDGTIKTIEPDISIYGDTWEILNYTYEIDYDEPYEYGPTYGTIIPEYLFIRYLGDNQSMNFFALKLDSSADASEIYENYKESLLQNGVEIDEGKDIGDQRIVAQTTFVGIPGNGMVFRRANCGFIIVGFSIDLDMTIDVAQSIDTQIQASIS